MLIKSLRNDRWEWCVAMAEAEEKTHEIGFDKHLFRIIKETSINNLAVSETNLEKGGTIIQFESRRLN